MRYGQIANGIFLREFDSAQLVDWDENNYCTPIALVKDGKADEFGVVELHPQGAPLHDALTQTAVRDGCELVGGHWQYKWRIDALTPEQIAKNQAAVEAIRVATLWQGAYDYEFAQISGVAIGMLVLGVLQAKPKALAAKGWSQSIWTEYYTRKANGSTDASYTALGDCPHSVPELMVELGL